MNRYFLFFLMFSFLALSAVGFSVYDSAFFNTDSSSAEGFGISPPYFQNNNLKPGDSYSQTIGIMRSQAKSPAKVEVNINADLFQSWLKIKPGPLVNLEVGDYNTPLNVSVNIPSDAKPGNYKGFIYLEFITDANKATVGIRTGARIDINLQVNSPEIIKTFSETKDFVINNDLLYGQLKGRIISPATNTGEFYYVATDIKQASYLGSSTDVIKIINGLSQGISNKNLEKIPLNLEWLTGTDSDTDGLPDNLEKSLGTGEKLTDTDSDGFNDLYEVTNGYSPLLRSQAMPIDLKFAKSVSGRIFMQVENKGQLWYVNPADQQRYFFATPSDAINILKDLSSNISETDFKNLKNF